MQGWQEVSFTDCLDKTPKASKIPKKQFLTEGTFPIVSQEQDLVSGFWDDEADVFKIEKPVVIFGDHTQCLKYIDFDFVVGADGVKILQPKNFLNAKFFHYYLMAHPVKSLGYARHYRLLKEISVTYPPLPEQQHIVEILDHAFEGIDKAIENTEKNLQNARELFESELNRIFTQKGDGWVEMSLKDLGKLQTGSTPKTSDKVNFGDYIPFVKPADFHANGELCYTNEGLSFEGAQKSRLIEKGSALMVCIGATIGKAGFSTQDVTTNQQVNTITPYQGYNEKYIYYHMLSKSFQKKVVENSGQATLPIINKTKWGNLTIHIPKDEEEQLGVVSRLQKLSSDTKAFKEVCLLKIEHLNNLKQSLLQKAFTGELTKGMAHTTTKQALRA